MSTERVALRAHVTKAPIIEATGGRTVARLGVVVHATRHGGDESWQNVLEPTDLAIHCEPADAMGLRRGAEILVRGTMADDPATGRRALFSATISTWLEPAGTTPPATDPDAASRQVGEAIQKQLVPILGQREAAMQRQVDTNFNRALWQRAVQNEAVGG